VRNIEFKKAADNKKKPSKAPNIFSLRYRDKLKKDEKEQLQILLELNHDRTLPIY